MIRTYFGLEREPFHPNNVDLLPAQEEILSTLRVHCQQGGLCVLIGEPGTGKSVIKHALRELDPKMLLTLAISPMAITCFGMAISRFGHRDQGDRSEATLGWLVVSSWVLVPFGVRVQ